MSAAPADRYHALDALRGFAMFLGIVLHVGISFMTSPPAFWPVHDEHSTVLADVFLIAVHDFRMQLFFLLAGFFGCLLYLRYGLVGMLKQRVRRVAIPFVLALAIIVPTVQAVGLYSEIENVRSGVTGEGSSLREYAAGLVAANPDATTGQLVQEFFLSGKSLASLPLVHLWFLFYLLIFFAIVALFAPALSRLSGTRLLARFDACFRAVLGSRARLLVFALATLPLMLTMHWAVDTPTSWVPRWNVLTYYFGFFVFGWMLYRHRDLVVAFGRNWKRNLAVANLVFLPLLLIFVIRGAGVEKAGAGGLLGWKAGAASASVLYTWLMIVGLWGCFLSCFSRGSAWARYMADASYWCYLASLTPILVLQFVVASWDLPGELKFVLVTLATMIVLLASYEWCVRYTYIGAVLNGRKHRARFSVATPPMQEEPAVVASGLSHHVANGNRG